MPPILHGTLLRDSAWDSRECFGYSTWVPRNGVPLGVPWRPEGYPISRPPDRISKNLSTIPCRTPYKGIMQSFKYFSQVVSSGKNEEFEKKCDPIILFCLFLTVYLMFYLKNKNIGGMNNTFFIA